MPEYVVSYSDGASSLALLGYRTAEFEAPDAEAALGRGWTDNPFGPDWYPVDVEISDRA